MKKKQAQNIVIAVLLAAALICIAPYFMTVKRECIMQQPGHTICMDTRYFAK